MAKNDVKVTDNPKLKQKKLSDGNFSLYLEYYFGYNIEVDEASGKTKVRAIRKKEFLGLTIYGTFSGSKESSSVLTTTSPIPAR